MAMVGGRIGAIAATHRHKSMPKAGGYGRPHSASRGGSSSTGMSRQDDGIPAEFAPLAPVVVGPWLEAYGYAVSKTGADAWRVSPTTASETPPATQSSGSTERASSIASVSAPQFSMVVGGHEEIHGHTWYVLACSLVICQNVRLDWQIQRRLVQLREHLHDPIREQLGSEKYRDVFGDAHFASKGGLPGTTNRLNAWCHALAAGINVGKCPPSLSALTLRFLGVPDPPAEWDEILHNQAANEKGNAHASSAASASMEAGAARTFSQLTNVTSQNNGNPYVAGAPAAASPALSTAKRVLATGAAAATAAQTANNPAPRSEFRAQDNEDDEELQI